MEQIIRWDSKLNVGTVIIDEQHKILFDLANDLNAAVNAGASKQVIDTLFTVIMSYAFKHFETEENLFKQDPQFFEHSYRHYKLLKQLHGYALDYRNNRAVQIPPGKFLEKWLIEHIEEFDIPLLSTKKGKMPPLPEIDKFEDFDSQELDRRQHKRVRYDKILDEDIIGHCYNANKMKSGTVTVVDLASGGLKLYAEQKMAVDDLVVISCRVGKNFRMKEKARVKYARGNFYGIGFVSPSEETVRFLTELCGAVHMRRY